MTEPTTADLAKQQLRDILDWAAILPALLTRRAPTGDTSRTGRSRSVPGSRPPVRLDVLHVLDTRTRVAGDDAEDRAWHDRMASDHRQGLLPDLWQWCRLIEAEAMDACPDVPEELPERPVLASVVDWLVKHTPWALTQPWADEYAADVDWWWRRLRDLIGEAGESGVPCGRCGDWLAMVHLGLWECRAGHQVTVQPVSVNLAAQKIGIPKDQLYALIAQPQQLRALGIEPPRPILGETGARRVYDLSDLRRLVAEVRVRRPAAS